MKRSSGPRKTASNLSESVHRQLNMYAIAASAAGVGILALAQPAEARIVYTRANVVIPPDDPFSLDLNHDANPDFYFWKRDGYHSVTLNLYAYKPRNRKWGGGGLVSALPAGVRVGADGKFQSDNHLMGQFLERSGNYYFGGQWINVQHRYVGLKFLIQGKVHYGWARLNVGQFVQATLTGYAYETIANKPIITGDIVGATKAPGDPDNKFEPANPASLTAPTPEPAALGALAVGAPGLSIWRREQLMVGAH